jgi:hypothetical protein
VEEVGYRWYQAKELLSYAVLRNSAGELRRSLRRRAADPPREDGGRLLVTEMEAGGRQILRADGSLRYDTAVLERTARERHDLAVRYATTLLGGLHDFRWNAERLARLERLWRDMRARGVAVTVFVPPYHPAAWALIRSDPQYARTLGAGVRALGEIAASTGVAFGDFSDPAAIPCAETEFHDGDHATAPCLSRILLRLRVPAGIPARSG